MVGNAGIMGIVGIVFRLLPCITSIFIVYPFFVCAQVLLFLIFGVGGVFPWAQVCFLCVSAPFLAHA